MQTIDQALDKLQTSPFRARFHLSEKDLAYVREKGTDTVRSHARDFIRARLAPALTPNNRKQTPIRRPPDFIVQHACTSRCRGCLYKWYRVPPGRALTEGQQEKIVNLLMAWIQREMDR